AHEQEKEGVQQELLPVSGGANAAAANPGTEHPGIAFAGYDPAETFLGTCPECSSELQFMEGCAKCLACGYSECGSEPPDGWGGGGAGKGRRLCRRPGCFYL